MGDKWDKIFEDHLTSLIPGSTGLPSSCVTCNEEQPQLLGDLAKISFPEGQEVAAVLETLLFHQLVDQGGVSNAALPKEILHASLVQLVAGVGWAGRFLVGGCVHGVHGFHGLFVVDSWGWCHTSLCGAAELPLSSSLFSRSFATLLVSMTLFVGCIAQSLRRCQWLTQMVLKSVTFGGAWGKLQLRHCVLQSSLRVASRVCPSWVGPWWPSPVSLLAAVWCANMLLSSLECGPHEVCPWMQM